MTLNATVQNSRTAPTDYWWRYGTTTTYGTETPHRTVQITGGAPPHRVSEPISGLNANTTYHFQFCVQDDEEDPPRAICSRDQTFATVGDYVRGAGGVTGTTSPGVVIFDNVRGGSAGENPAGVVHFVTLSGTIVAPVKCLRTAGDKATVGLDMAFDLFVFIDLGQGSYSEELVGSRSLTDCPAAAGPGDVFTLTPMAFSGFDPVTVHDSP